VKGEFDGGHITSDGGVVLLREVEERRWIIKRLAQCFVDYRDDRYCEHSVEELLRQRIYGIALGYEDLNDHDELRVDQLLAAAVGKEEPTGAGRRRERDKGKALAGKSTLNRMELRSEKPEQDGRYKKIAADETAIERLFVEIFLESVGEEPDQIVLDLDSTDDLIHGKQEGRFFHAYYGGYCYLPLYIFCEDYLLCARLREANHGDTAGVVDELTRIVGQIRERWRNVRIVLRGDSAFGMDSIMTWCEQNKVDYIFGKAKNSRLEAEIKEEQELARQEYEKTGLAARVYKDFRYRTLDSWSRDRRVVAKAEQLAKGSNPRFIVTSLTKDEIEARELYEKQYCARGEMENRIKEQQLYLFADRTSTRMMKSNQLRLWFSSIAYVLMNELRRSGLNNTELEDAQCERIRLNLFKIGALIRVTVRRVLVSFSSAYPYERVFEQVYLNLTRLPLRR
jgi:Transposase DDE domain group 1